MQRQLNIQSCQYTAVIILYLRFTLVLGEHSYKCCRPKIPLLSGDKTLGNFRKIDFKDGKLEFSTRHIYVHCHCISASLLSMVVDGLGGHALSAVFTVYVRHTYPIATSASHRGLSLLKLVPSVYGIVQQPMIMTTPKDQRKCWYVVFVVTLNVVDLCSKLVSVFYLLYSKKAWAEEQQIRWITTLSSSSSLQLQL